MLNNLGSGEEGRRVRVLAEAACFVSQLPGSSEPK